MQVNTFHKFLRVGLFLLSLLMASCQNKSTTAKNIPGTQTPRVNLVVDPATTLDPQALAPPSSTPTRLPAVEPTATPIAKFTSTPEVAPDLPGQSFEHPLVEEVKTASGLMVADLDGAVDRDVEGTEISGSNSPTVDCRAEGLPELACTGVSSNQEWTPVIQEFEGVPMVLVPVGCFIMGSTDEQIDYAMGTMLDRRGFYQDEQPAHQQCFTEPFWIDLTEVTVGQYGSYDVLPGDELPREYISWFDSAAHCESRGTRLPTEVEWEYAARGPDSLVYPWGNEFDPTRLNYCDSNCLSPGAEMLISDGYNRTAPVGSYPGGASWVGALDMSGNVWEWTSNLLFEYPYRADDGREALPDFDKPGLRTLRGGGWADLDYALRSANRNEHGAVDQITTFGFRCVLPIGKPLP